MPFVELKSFDIYYEKAGHGYPLVILHGMGNNSQSWQKQISGLQDHFTVIAWDAPGYGKSSDPSEELREFSQFADVLKEFIESLNYENVYLLGHSMGAAIALDFCHKYPHMVSSLIIADATRGAAALTEEENKKKLESRLHSIETLEGYEIAKNRVPELLSPDVNNDIKKEAIRIMSQIRPAGYRSVAYSLYHLNQMEILSDINLPTLIICGEQDKVTPVSESQVFNNRIALSQFVTIPKAGHLCYQENPVSFNHHIIEFLKK